MTSWLGVTRRVTSCEALKPVLLWIHLPAVRGTEFRCLLVLSAIRRKTGNTRRHFFWANLFAGISALLASRLALRIGLIRTMVVTPFAFQYSSDSCAADAKPQAGGAGPARAFQHQPDGCPARQSYTMAVVSAENDLRQEGLRE